MFLIFNNCAKSSHANCIPLSVTTVRGIPNRLNMLRGADRVFSVVACLIANAAIHLEEELTATKCIALSSDPEKSKCKRDHVSSVFGQSRDNLARGHWHGLDHPIQPYSLKNQLGLSLKVSNYFSSNQIA